MPHVGTSIGGRYALGEVLGRGGMADVYRAVDTSLERPVAVKVLREGADSDADRARFTAEARTLAQLSHTGLVMVLDAGITAPDAGSGVPASAERPYIVMELVEGTTLGRALAEGPLPPDRVGAIGVQVAEALAYAHTRGVVHRDVKPGNVLLGADGRVKLADFGIARLIGDAVRHTRTGQAIGTAAYLAPEQVTGRDIDGAADVYSLGLVLLEALTGERAYPGTPTESAVARLSRPPEVPASLPGPWRGLLADMTALDPMKRPGAAEVAARLRTQPTGPVPDAGVCGADATRRLTQPVTARPTDPDVSTSDAAPAPRLDRAGDAIAAQARDGVARLRTLPSHQLAVAGVLAVLVLFLVVVAVVGGGSDGSDGGDIPSHTPDRLRQPLTGLHSAVEGG